MVRRVLLLAVVSWLCVGCAAVETKRATDLSVAGVAYAKAVSELVDVTNAEHAEFAATSAMALSPVVPPPADSRAAFEKQTAGVVATIKQRLLIKAAARSLEDYFQALSELAGANPSELLVKSAKGALESANAASQALGNSNLITDAQLKRFEGVGGVVLEQLHGKALADRLKADGRIVGQALVAFDLAIVGLEGQYKQLLRDNSTEQEMPRVILPWVNGKAVEKATWKDDFKASLRRNAQPPVNETLQKSRKASQKMQEAWEAAVNGLDPETQSKLVIKELTTMFDDLAKLR